MPARLLTVMKTGAQDESNGACVWKIDFYLLTPIIISRALYATIISSLPSPAAGATRATINPATLDCTRWWNSRWLEENIDCFVRIWGNHVIGNRGTDFFNGLLPGPPADELQQSATNQHWRGRGWKFSLQKRGELQRDIRIFRQRVRRRRGEGVNFASFEKTYGTSEVFGAFMTFRRMLFFSHYFFVFFSFVLRPSIRNLLHVPAGTYYAAAPVLGSRIIVFCVHRKSAPFFQFFGVSDKD